MNQKFTDYYISTENQIQFHKDCNIYIGKYDYNNISDILYHDHSGDFELCLITRGYGYHYINDSVKEASKGNVLLIDPKSKHSLFPVDRKNSTRLQVINCVFNRSIFEDFGNLTPIWVSAIDNLANLSKNHPLYESNNCLDKDLAEFCQPLIQHIEYLSQHGNDINMHTIVTSIALMILEIYRKASRVKPKTDISNQKPLLSQAIGIIHKNYQNPNFMIGDIYDALYVSKSYLCSMFKTHLNISPLQMLNNQRIKFACERIHAVGYCDKSLYQESGYSEYNTFYINFKKVTGLSVRDYVKALTIVRNAKDC